jgi:hypothetical protein
LVFKSLDISSNFGVNTTSIRLFFDFPSLESFDAMGANSPRPAAVKRSGLIAVFSLKISTIAVARLVDKSQLLAI